MALPANLALIDRSHAAPWAVDPAPNEANVTVTVVLVTYNNARLLKGFFESLKRATANLDWDCVVVDNASRDRSADVVERHAMKCRLIRNAANVGFARANNQAIPYLNGKYALLLNPDVVLPESALRKSIAFMETHPECGILGVKLVDPGGTLQPCCRYFPTPFNLFVQRAGLHRLFSRTRMPDDMDWHHSQVRKCDWVPGCFYLMRKEVIEQIGLFDPRYFLYYEEVDHCRAAKRAGWDVVFYPEVEVVHLGGESARSDGAITEGERQIESIQVESEVLYFRKNHGASGLCSYAFLMSIAAVLVACKSVFKGRARRAINPSWQRLLFLWSTLFRTSWGTSPTR